MSVETHSEGATVTLGREGVTLSHRIFHHGEGDVTGELSMRGREEGEPADAPEGVVDIVFKDAISLAPKKRAAKKKG